MARHHCRFLTKSGIWWQSELGKDILTNPSFSPPSSLPALQVSSLALEDSQELTASLLSAGSQVSWHPCACMSIPMSVLGDVAALILNLYQEFCLFRDQAHLGFILQSFFHSTQYSPSSLKHSPPPISFLNTCSSFPHPNWNIGNGNLVKISCFRSW